jgi:hypothetical protein
MNNYKKTIPTFFVFLLFVTWSNLSNADDPVACTGAGSSADEITTTLSVGTPECLTEPDIYKIKIYEMGVCATAPTLTNLATACTPISTIANGGLITVANGVNSAIPGTFTRPDNGTYAYGYVIMAPEFRITSTKTFNTTYRGLSANTGTTCWTLAGTTRDSLTTTAYDGSGTLVAMDAEKRTTYLADCGSTPAPGETILVQDSFGGADISIDSADAHVGPLTVGNATVEAYLTDADLVQATTSAAVARLVGFVTLGDVITVSDDTSTFVSSFSVSQGSQVIWTGQDSINNIRSMGSGPFAVKFSVE